MELRHLSRPLDISVVDTLANHYMVYYAPVNSKSWALIDNDALPFDEMRESINQHALINLTRLKSEKIVPPVPIYRGDYAVLTFIEDQPNCIPMRTAILDPRLILDLLKVNYNISLKLQRYFLSWMPLDNKLIVTQDPKRNSLVAAENGLDFDPNSPILSITVPGHSLVDGNPHQAIYSDLMPVSRSSH